MQQQGKNMSEMAREVGVTPQRIWWWRKRLQSKKQPERVSKPRFVEVTAPNRPEARKRAFAIHTPNGQTVEVWPGFDAGELHRLLVVVKEAAC